MITCPHDLAHRIAARIKPNPTSGNPFQVATRERAARGFLEYLPPPRRASIDIGRLLVMAGIIASGAFAAIALLQRYGAAP